MKKLLDGLGMFTSIACAIHCIAFPILVGSLGFMGSLSHWTVDVTFLGLGMVFIYFSIYRAYLVHHKPLALILAALGLIAIAIALLLHNGAFHHLIALCGVLWASAHMVNIWLVKNYSVA